MSDTPEPTRTVQCLFLGGPWDGQRQMRSVLPQVIEVPVALPLANEIANQIAQDNGIHDGMVLNYSLRSITNYPVYVAPEVDENNIIHFLLDGYRSPHTKH